MRIALEGYERDRRIRWMKVYRAKISVNGETRVSRRPFRRATTAEMYAERWAERA